MPFLDKVLIYFSFFFNLLFSLRANFLSNHFYIMLVLPSLRIPSIALSCFTIFPYIPSFQIH